MNNPKVSINVITWNCEKYIRGCLESVIHQTCAPELIEVNILDNGSSDKTVEIIEECLPHFSNFVDIRFIKNSYNLGMWGGQEVLLEQTRGSYLVVLSADVILEKDFIQRAIEKMDAHPHLGAIQGKVFQFNISEFDRQPLPREIIDTCGFVMYKSRKIGNIGHGEKDHGQFEEPKEIFGVEGAVPIFRTEAFKSIKVMGEIMDHDFFWYAEDLDIAWRLRLAGWSQRYEPSVIAWHDRGTTKGHTHGSWLEYLRRVHVRRTVPLQRRRLEWRNSRWTRIKNDYIINILKDLPYIALREMEVLGYMILFEPGILKEVPRFFRGIPLMLRKRKMILTQAKVGASQIRNFFA